MRMPRRVGRINGLWSHLTADTEIELLAFAKELGLREAWFQRQCKLAPCRPCPHWHFDVTEPKRLEAIRRGAREVSMGQFGDFIRARRAALRALADTATT